MSVQKREPRTDELWRKVLWSTPFSSPGIVDGKLISNIYSNRYISIGERSCPLDYYYNYGYNVDTDNVLNLDLALEQKLDFITPGLSMNIKGAYNTNYNVKASRTPSGADSMCTPIYLGSIETPGNGLLGSAFRPYHCISDGWSQRTARTDELR